MELEIKDEKVLVSSDLPRRTALNQLSRIAATETMSELLSFSSGNRTQVGTKNLVPEKGELVSLLAAFRWGIFRSLR